MKIFLVLLIMCGIAHAQSIAQEGQGQVLDPVFPGLQWKNRVLVITGPEGDPFYTEQFDLLQGAYDGLAERSVLVLHFPGRIIQRIDALSSFAFRDRLFRKAGPRRYLEERLQVDDDVFSVALVGFDGLTRQVWAEPVEPQDIFAVIDTPVDSRQ